MDGNAIRAYTFSKNYYWMAANNPVNLSDSRLFGFVPEDHIVGTPMFVIISIDEEKGLFSGFRFDRMFKAANPDK